MLRRLKAQVSQVVDELPGVLNSSRESRDSNSFVEEEEIEGLICPVCMQHFGTPEQLSSHFETHNEASGVANPNYDASGSSSAPAFQSSFNTKDGMIDELKTQLAEEKKFSARLKEELHNIQSVIASDVPEGEVPYLTQQIQVLTADKGMITRQFLELEKDSSQQKRQLEQAHAERTDLMGKLKQMSSQLRELTDEVESIKIQREDLSRQLKTANSDIRKYETEVERLEKMLDTRPSDDDVNVLRTELVNAQRLMDDISREKDVEIQEQLTTIRNLSMEREKQHMIMETMTKKLAERDLETKGSSDELTKLNVDAADLRCQVEALQAHREDLVAEVRRKEIRIEELQTRIDENVTELSSCIEKINTLEEKVATSTKAIESSSQLNANNESKLGGMAAKLENLVQEKKAYEEKVNTFEEKLQKNNENIRSLEMANMNLTNELSSVGSLLEQERKLLAEKNSELSKKDQEIHELKEKVSEAERQLTKLKNEYDEAEKSIQKLTSEVVTLKENSQDLMKKVTEGEGGAKMAIDQLGEENKKHKEEIDSLKGIMKEQNDTWEKKLSETEKKLRENEAKTVEKEQKWKEEKEDFARKLKENEEEIHRKTERFVEMEKETEEERQKHTDRMVKVKEAVEGKNKTIEELRKNVEELTLKIGEGEQSVREKDGHLEESKKKIEFAIKRLEEAEQRANELEEIVRATEAGREEKAKESEQLKAKLAESEAFIEQLKVQVEEVAGQLREKQAEMEALIADVAEKEAHWKTKRDEFVNQLEKNQEANEETHQSLIRANEEGAQKSDTIGQLMVKLVEAKDSHQEVIQRLRIVEEEKQAIKEQLEATKKNYIDVTVEKEELASTIFELKTQIQENSNSLEIVQKEQEQTIAELRTKLAELEDRRSEAEHNLEMTTEEAQSLKHGIEEKDSEILSLTEANKLLQEDVERKHVEIESFNARIADFELEMAAEKRRIEGLESQKLEEAEKFELVLLKNAESQKNSAETHSKLTQEVENMKAALDEKDASLKKMEMVHADFRNMFETVQKEMKKELEEKEQKIELLGEEFSKNESLLTKKMNDLESELEKQKRVAESLDEELRRSRERMTEAEKKAADGLKTCQELTQQIMSWQEEKNALLERCLNGESDLDFERERAIENKRRFDEALSAMHELGRANQSLQMDMDRVTSRKWLDDSAAVNCTDCGKVFTMTVRKHHCRMCGLIFCNPCSSKTTRIPSAKNPVRACNNCYNEVQNR